MAENSKQDQAKFDDTEINLINRSFEDYLQDHADDTNCPLCSYKASDTRHLLKHLRAGHFSHAVCFEYNGDKVCCLPCRKSCLSGGIEVFKHLPQRSHYHCPNCKRVITRRTSFKTHVAHRIDVCATAPSKAMPAIFGIKDVVEVENEASDDSKQLVSVVVDGVSLDGMMDGSDGESENGNKDLSFSTSSPPNQPKKRKFEQSENTEESNEADEMFLKSLLPEIKMISGEKKMKLKLDIMMLVHKAAYRPQHSWARKSWHH